MVISESQRLSVAASVENPGAERKIRFFFLDFVATFCIFSISVCQ